MTNAKLTSKQQRRPRAGLQGLATIDRPGLRDDLGHRLREAREQKKIGLRELARRLGVSASLISQIETGKREPSIKTLFAIVSELELSVNEIVFDLKRDAGPAAPPAQNGPDSRQTGELRPAAASKSPVQHSTNRTSISLESGVSWQRLTAQPDHNVDFLYLRYPPGSESTPPHSLMRHNGTEYGYILTGRLQVSLGFDTYEVEPGDSIAFDCTQPHRFATVGDETVEAVWFVVGPQEHTLGRRLVLGGRLLVRCPLAGRLHILARSGHEAGILQARSAGVVPGHHHLGVRVVLEAVILVLRHEHRLARAELDRVVVDVGDARTGDQILDLLGVRMPMDVVLRARRKERHSEHSSSKPRRCPS